MSLELDYSKGRGISGYFSFISNQVSLQSWLSEYRYRRNTLDHFSFSRQLFIGNLCQVTLESLRTYCEKYGPIIDLSINRDKDNNVNIHFIFH